MSHTAAARSTVWTMTHAKAIVDLRIPSGLPAHSAAANQLKNLGPGEVYELIIDVEPTSLMHACQEEVKDALRWEVVAFGPPVWRLRVCREREALAADVANILDQDHERLDGLLESALHCLENDDLDGAFEQLRRFASGLRRHIHAEVDVLRPMLATEAADAPHIVHHMETEHAELLDRLMSVERWIEHREVASANAYQLRELRQVLGRHETEERHRMNPIWARVLGAMENPDEQQRLYSRIVAILDFGAPM